MKLSLWQQFSSNHSTRYTLAGVFDTPENAQQAAEKFRQIIVRVEKWMKDNPEKLPPEYEQRIPSEIEKQLGQEYQIAWDVAVEWWAELQVEVVFDRLVTVAPEWQISYSPEPLDQLMQRLGGKPIITGYGWSEPYGEIFTRIICTPPDDAAVEAIKTKWASDEDDDEYKIVLEKDKTDDVMSIRFSTSYFNHFTELIQDLQKQQYKDISFNLFNIRYIEIDRMELKSDSAKPD